MADAETAPISVIIRASDAAAFLQTAVRHGTTRAAKKHGLDSSLGETPARDPRRFGVQGAYPRVGKRVSARLIRRLYDEVGIYRSVVDTWAESTWSDGWVHNTRDNAWKKAAESLEYELDLKTTFEDADREHLQHGHSLVYFDLDDAADVDAAPSSVRQVLGVEVIPPEDVLGVEKDDDGQVLQYRLRFDRLRVELVHRDRVLLVRERKKRHPFRGHARVRPTLDDVLGYENVKWSAYESYHQRAAPYLEARIAPNVKVKPEDADRIKSQIDDLQSGVIQKIVSENFELVPHTGASGLVNPMTYWGMAVDSVSASARVPKHMLVGTAAGAVQSAEEDELRFIGRVKRRRNNHAAKLVTDWLELAAAWGLLAPVPEDYTVSWSELKEPSPSAVMALEEQRAKALALYMALRIPVPGRVAGYEPGALPTGPLPPVPAPAPATPAERPPAPPEGSPAPPGEGAGPGGDRIVFLPGRDNRLRAWRIWEHRDEAANPVDVPDLKPVVARGRVEVELVLLDMEAEYLRAFDEDARVRTPPTNADRRDAVDPEDELVTRLLSIEFSPQRLQDVLLRLMLASGEVGGLVAWRELGMPGVFKFIDDTEIRVFRTLAQFTAESENALIVERIRRGIAQGIVDGDSLQGLRARVADAFEALEPRSNLIARSEAMRGFNVGAREGMRQAGLSQFRFNAFSEACEICAPLDGEVFGLDDTEHLPPMHPQCRCRATGVVST